MSGSSIEDVRIHSTAAGSIGTDHSLLRIKLKFHLRSRRKVIKAQLQRIDRKKHKSEQCKLVFQRQLNARPQQQQISSQTIDDKDNSFVDYVHQVSGAAFQPDENGGKQKEWLTDEILDLVDKKAKAFLDCQNFRGTTLESKYKRAITYFEIWRKRKQHDPATAHSMIRRLRGEKVKIESLPIFDKDGEILTNSKERLDRWKDYFNFNGLLNVPSNVDQLTIQQIIPATIDPNEQRRQDKAPSLTEVQCVLKQMKNGKVPGNNGISADIIKAGGLPMVKWLHEIFVDIWGNETIVEDWTTAILIRLYKNKGDKKICDN
ncbi:unnamed protein product [Rotaria magnacalcarata]|uniref:Reverse transcriptase n=2 Tax=Rotaria magnacalcarata TaxID=392030 RepID=A0A820CYS2_9BILA|nr:unnamed protein product [Rotaria magnacalcarata]CAF3918447.1 unnamed protein product [Rotaria magnacalcarata]CAF4225183.1 unnamed protein product [Rotaria magnacalcarata]